MTDRPRGVSARTFVVAPIAIAIRSQPGQPLVTVEKFVNDHRALFELLYSRAVA